MGMRKVSISKLSKPVQAFLSQVQQGEGLLVEDETGRAQYGVILYTEATEEERLEAWTDIEKIRKKVRKQMEERGSTEDELDRILQEDD